MIKLRFLSVWENFLASTIGPIYRSIGQKLFIQGVRFQGSMSSDDRLVKNLTSVVVNSLTPSIDKASFVAPNSVLVGNIELDDNSSVWYGATLRGDNQGVQVGRNSVIQDNSYLLGTNVGQNVYIGPNVFLGKCQIKSSAFIGMGSTIGDGTIVSGVVAAGSVVSPNENVKPGQVWAGSPAKFLREVTPEEIQVLREHKQEIVDLAAIHAEENNKPFREILDDQDEVYRKKFLTSEQAAHEQLAKLNFPLDNDDEEFIEHRVFLKQRSYFDDVDTNANSEMDLYEQDLSNFPANFQIHQEDYEIYDKAKKYFEENPSAEAKIVRDNRDAHPSQKSQGPWNNKYL